jgi:uncharacterized protein YjiS (DUF1127 family)
MLLGHLVRLLRTWQRYHAGVRELSRLSDIELADIGLTRSEIPWIAWRGARNDDAQSAATLRRDAWTDVPKDGGGKRATRD